MLVGKRAASKQRWLENKRTGKDDLCWSQAKKTVVATSRWVSISDGTKGEEGA